MKSFALGFVAAGLVFPPTSSAQVLLDARMPPEIRVLHEASGSEIGNGSRCEVLEWIIDPSHGLPTGADGPVEKAQHHLSACRMPHEDITAEEAARRLNGKTFRFDIEGDVMTLVGRSAEEGISFCCAPTGSLSRLGDSIYWAARYRMADLERAMITIIPDNAGDLDDYFHYYRGPLAPPQPVETPIGKWKGRMTEGHVRSEALGETRLVMVYLPPGYSKKRTWPALFITNYDVVKFAGLVEVMIEAGEIEPIVIISPGSGVSGIIGQAPTEFGDLSESDYLPGAPQGGGRFASHMEFFSEELVAYAVHEFAVSPNRLDRAVAGRENGAVFALWAGLQKPDAFASAVAMSPGWKAVQPDEVKPSQQVRFFLSAGLYEPPSIMSAQKSEASLKDRGAPVEGRYYSAGPMHDQWAVALREALLKIFPAEPRATDLR